MGFVSAITPETITVDGDVSEWSTDTELATDSNGVSLHVTWDSTNFYVAWTGTDWASLSDGAGTIIGYTTIKSTNHKKAVIYLDSDDGKRKLITSTDKSIIKSMETKEWVKRKVYFKKNQLVH